MIAAALAGGPLAGDGDRPGYLITLAAVAVLGVTALAPLIAHRTAMPVSVALRAHEVLVVERVVLASRSEEHTSELQSPCNLVCRLLLEKKKNRNICHTNSHNKSLTYHFRCHLQLRDATSFLSHQTDHHRY